MPTLRKSLAALQENLAKAKFAGWQSPEMCDILATLVTMAISFDEQLTVIEMDELRQRRNAKQR